MTSDHLGSIPKKGPGYFPGPGYGFGLGFAVRESLGVANKPGSVGDYYWSGAGGLSFYVNPREELCAVYMAKTNTFGLDGYLVSLFRVLTMQAIVD